jgi:hypothetical protein
MSMPAFHAWAAAGQGQVRADLIGVSLLVAAFVAMLLWSLVREFRQATIFTLPSSQISVRRRAAFLWRRRDLDPRGTAFRLGPVRPINKVYVGNAPIEYAATGVELVRDGRVLRVAHQLQGTAARALLEAVTRACNSEVVHGVSSISTPANIRVASPSPLSIVVTPSASRWFVTIVGGTVAAGFCFVGFRMVQQLMHTATASWDILASAVFSFVAVVIASVMSWYGIQTLTGKERIELNDTSLSLRRTSLLGAVESHLLLASITSIEVTAWGSEESFRESLQRSLAMLLGPVIIRAGDRTVRLGRFGFLDQGPLLLEILLRARPELGDRVTPRHLDERV